MSTLTKKRTRERPTWDHFVVGINIRKIEQRSRIQLVNSTSEVHGEYRVCELRNICANIA